MAQEPIREPSDDRLRRAFDDGYAAATSGEEAAPGCTTTAEGRAFLSGYVEGAKARGAAASATDASS
jgi:ribosome modulation factor